MLPSVLSGATFEVIAAPVDGVVAVDPRLGHIGSPDLTRTG
jgi:hypothetical protein